MKIDVLVAEIGSTTTLINAFNNVHSEEPQFWGQGQASTSVVDGDVRTGLKSAIDDLCRKKGVSKDEYLQVAERSKKKQYRTNKDENSIK